MKSKINKIIAAILIYNLAFTIYNCEAQSIPNAVNFQAIARNAGGSLITNANVQVKVEVLDGSNSGPVMVTLVYTPTTDAYGQFTFAIGAGSPVVTAGTVANFAAIDWASSAKFIKVSLSPLADNNYTLISNTQATASFYAFGAKTAEKVNITGTSGQVLKHNGTTWVAGTDNSGGALPEGMISPFGGTAAPTGWLLCDGSAVSRTTYSTLFAAIGVAYGSGDGSTTFNLPDLRGRFMRGVDGTANNDPDKASRTASNTGGNTGNNVGSLQVDEFNLHGHPYRTGSNGSSTNDAGGLALETANQESWPAFNGTPTSNRYEMIGGAGGNETRPKNVYVNYIIKH